MDERLAANRANWDDRAALHAARDGSGYAVQQYVDDRALLSDVVRFDVPLLGDVAGLRGVHLQCHIGTDTLSLARRGARMTGLDFSSASVAAARALVAETGDQVEFVESNVYDALHVLPTGEFDFVFTGIGALGWLPKVDPWAKVVAALLAPGGFLFIREGHPFLFTMDETADALEPHYPYWEHEEPLVFDDATTYVPTEGTIEATRTYEWNRSLGEIVTALANEGLRIDLLVEHDSVPWDALPGRLELGDDGEYRMRDRPERLPLTFTLRASKPRG